jgi:hypothetical protein
MFGQVWGGGPYTVHGLDWVSEAAWRLHRSPGNIKPPCVAFGQTWWYECNLGRCQCGVCGDKFRCSVSLFDTRGNLVYDQLVFTCDDDEGVNARSWALTVASQWNADLTIVDVMGESETISLEDNRNGLTGSNS